MKKYSTLTQDRYLLLFIKYLNVVKGYGDNARFIAKSKMVAEAAEMVSLSPERAARVINKMLRERNKPHKITVIECNELLHEIECTHKFIHDDIDRKVDAVNKILTRVGIVRTQEEVKHLVQEHLINA